MRSNSPTWLADWVNACDRPSAHRSAPQAGTQPLQACVFSLGASRRFEGELLAGLASEVRPERLD